MKKVTLLLAVLTIVLSGIRINADDCGHQHAERCLVYQPTTEKTATELGLPAKFRIFISVLLRSRPPI